MKKKRMIALVLAAAVLAFSGAVHAMPPAIDAAVLEKFEPAIWHRGLETAYEQPDPSKLRSFVVVEKGGIPVERARYYITWSDYDYRGAVVHEGEGGHITTRRGSPYAYLQRGDVMAVAGIKYFNRTVYLKLISADVYVPVARKHDKRHSRVTVMLGFDLPKDAVKSDDADAAIASMSAWLKPFPNLADAQAYATGLKDEQAFIAGQPPSGAGAGAAKAAGKSEAAPAAESSGAGDERMKSLEEKIEKARRDLDEAEQELKDMKKGK